MQVNAAAPGLIDAAGMSEPSTPIRKSAKVTPEQSPLGTFRLGRGRHQGLLFLRRRPRGTSTARLIVDGGLTKSAMSGWPPQSVDSVGPDGNS